MDDYRIGYIDGEASRDAEVASLKAENESLLKNLRGKHALTGATYEHLIKERDQLHEQVTLLRGHLAAIRKNASKRDAMWVENKANDALAAT